MRVVALTYLCLTNVLRIQMVEFFTILFIDYEAPEYGMAPMASVVYATEDHCQEAMDRGLADPLYDHLMGLYGKDIMMWCYVTDEVSVYVRPRARPEDDGGGEGNTSLSEEPGEPSSG